MGNWASVPRDICVYLGFSLINNLWLGARQRMKLFPFAFECGGEKNVQVLLKAIALSELYVEEYFHFVSNFILLSFMFSEITTMYNVYLTTTVPFTEKKTNYS